MFSILLLVTVITLFFAIYYTSKQRLQYWSKRNVPYLKPLPLLGNYSEYILLRKHIGQITQNLCQKFPHAPFFGAFYGTEPTLIVQDPDLIKLITTKDFNFFRGREVSKYYDRELLAQNMFFSYGDEWKALRQYFTPLFTTAKMKKMFGLIENCSRVFENILDKEIKGSNLMEVRTLMARFTMDCIGSCAFGVETYTMEKKENNPFRAIGDSIFDTQNSRGLKNVVRTIWPAIFYGLGFKVFPKDVEEFFYKLLTGIFERRQNKLTTRHDFVDLVLKLKYNEGINANGVMEPNSEKKFILDLYDDVLVSQCFIFFAAGYETSATTLSFTMFELAKNPEKQEKLLEEIDAYLSSNNNMLKYECVNELPYLEACIDEALRLYPVLGVLTREVTDDYILSNGLKLEKGLRVHLPVYHLHHNPDNFPELEQYRPERFLGEEKRNIKPYTYMPFGEGQRICIGMRFAKMQMTAGLITILKKYRLELAEDMKSTVEFEPKAVVTLPIGGIRLKFIEREGWQSRILQSPQII